jgi:hypothetical protein
MMLPFMSPFAHRATSDKPGSRVWWVRLAITCLFLVWFNAVAVHALTEPHEGASGHNHASVASDCERGLMHHHEKECHPPHMASDHGYLLAKRLMGAEQPPAILAPPGFEPLVPPVHSPVVAIRHPHFSGADPPSPAQPRAPPIS